MLKYIIKRILVAIPVLIGITIIDYALCSMAGQPLAMLQTARTTAEALAQKEAMLGLDQPVYIQYFLWLKEICTGNLGTSYSSYQPVTQLIANNIGPTLLLMGVSFVLSLCISLPAGIYSATHQYAKGDYAVVGVSFLSSSVPSFFLALVFIYIFTVQLQWLPSSGMITLGTGGDFWDIVRHLVMPASVLAIGMAGTNIRYFRSAMLEILQKDYLRTARAKGIGSFLVINKHALRNALLTVITVIGMQIPLLFGGAVIVEQVFSWPGIGLLTINSINAKDYPVIMGVCLLSAVVVLLGNLLTDILYAVADPTIQLD